MLMAQAAWLPGSYAPSYLDGMYTLVKDIWTILYSQQYCLAFLVCMPKIRVSLPRVNGWKSNSAFTIRDSRYSYL